MVRLDRVLTCAGMLLFAPWVATAADPAAAVPPAPEYNRDIRPILSDRCFRCHGPDAAQRKAHLRLDQRDEAVAARDGTPALVAGHPDESELYLRITSDDPAERMPPHDAGPALTPRQIDLLRRWIEQGAPYQPHWAFLPPRSAALPDVRQGAWPRHPIDRFVLAELERRGLKPAPEASPETLLRRATLDLTGLPPTLAELDRFLADPSPDAYERAVDRLLRSPRYGERMALDWLDAARYADTNGYYTDGTRDAWPWRSWVIAAFNANMPFDRFTIEQLAGDLLPGSTLDQKIATGFNRNHMVTNETGVIDEEYRVGYVADRVDTTATVWLGMTIGCARCHDHKYDPVTQQEYYQLFAFFNTIQEQGLIKDKDGTSPLPALRLPTAEQEQTQRVLRARRLECEARLKAEEPDLARQMAAWEPTALAALPQVAETGRLACFDFDQDGSDRGPDHLEARTLGTLTLADGVRGMAAAFDSTQYVEFEGPKLDRDIPFSLTLWIKPGSAPSGCVASKMDGTAEARGFEIIWYKAQPRVNLVHEWGRDSIEVVAGDRFPAGQWHHLAVTYDGRGKAAGLSLYVDGRLQTQNVLHDSLSGSIHTEEPWRIAWKATGVGFDGSLDEVRLFNRPLETGEIDAMYWRDVLEGIVPTPPARRTKAQSERLRSFFLSRHGSDRLKTLTRELAAVRAEEGALGRQIVSASVMQEMATPRATHVLHRGQYDQPAKPVRPGIPAALGALTPDSPRNRLGLARWLVAPSNPLTARVAVNRFWQLAFGEGLVRTINDLGTQGELPTHPELIDWLAVDFMRSGWDVKRLMKQLLTSATYRQASDFTPGLLAHDPENRLLARGPRYRLPAEAIRDQALALGGLLVERLGGPSVKPYQPPGLWEAVSYNGELSYVQDHGEALYRRSLYTFWKRQAPPPGILAFDGPTREVCTVRRARTNTPLQALVLLNDVTYVEAARGLAVRMIREGGRDPAGRVRHGFRWATGRLPNDAEAAALEDFYRTQLASLRDRPSSARAVLRAGEACPDPAFDPCELAAWTMTASVLLNLDETITQH